METLTIAYYEYELSVSINANRKQIFDLINDSSDDEIYNKKGNRTQYSIFNNHKNNSRIIKLRSLKVPNLKYEPKQINLSISLGEIKELDVEIALLNFSDHLKGDPTIQQFEIENWMKNIMLYNGFSVTDLSAKVLNTIKISKPGRKDLFIPRAYIRVIGCVVDVTKFTHCLVSGIGKHKNYGFGMINIAS